MTARHSPGPRTTRRAKDADLFGPEARLWRRVLIGVEFAVLDVRSLH